MSAVSSSDARLRALLEAGLALASELSLDALLHRLVEAAAEITAARYAALGVIDPSGSQLERFLTVGIEPDSDFLSPLVLSSDFATGKALVPDFFVPELD